MPLHEPMLPELSARHVPTGLNAGFTATGLSFPTYIEHSCEMLHRVHQKLGHDSLDEVVAGNAPFMMVPDRTDGKKRGVVITHGLTDSPYFMRPVAEFLRQQGFYVYGMLLPGHGTQPGDLLVVHWQDWVDTVAYGVEQISQQVDELYLAGYSAGGLASVCHSLSDARIKALMLFSPAFQISSRAALAHWHRWYSWYDQKAKWITLCPDRSPFKYESFCKNAAAQLYDFTQHVAQLMQNKTLDIPMFVALSEDDASTDSRATLQVLSQHRHPLNRLQYYTRRPEQVLVCHAACQMIDSVLPAQHILSSAHTAIMLPASDKHFGLNGDYINALHYYPQQMDKYHACFNRNAEVLYGEIIPENLAQGLMRRLMFNPNFKLLTAALADFITAIESLRFTEK